MLWFANNPIITDRLRLSFSSATCDIQCFQGRLEVPQNLVLSCHYRNSLKMLDFKWISQKFR